VHRPFDWSIFPETLRSQSEKVNISGSYLNINCNVAHHKFPEERQFFSNELRGFQWMTVGNIYCSTCV
jgi:hypothetical protein